MKTFHKLCLMMENQDDLSAMYSGIAANDKDWLRYSVLADWYEEQGRQDEANAIKWLVTNQRRPSHRFGQIWAWYDSKSNPKPGLRYSTIDQESQLPTVIFQKLDHVQSVSKYYDSFRAAVEDFIQAWIAVNKESTKPQ